MGINDLKFMENNSIIKLDAEQWWEPLLFFIHTVSGLVLYSLYDTITIQAYYIMSGKT